LSSVTIVILIYLFLALQAKEEEYRRIWKRIRSQTCLKEAPNSSEHRFRRLQYLRRWKLAEPVGPASA